MGEGRWNRGADRDCRRYVDRCVDKMALGVHEPPVGENDPVLILGAGALRFLLRQGLPTPFSGIEPRRKLIS
jgi:hypothetical protein